MLIPTVETPLVILKIIKNRAEPALRGSSSKEAARRRWLCWARRSVQRVMGVSGLSVPAGALREPAATRTSQLVFAVHWRWQAAPAQARRQAHPLPTTSTKWETGQVETAFTTTRPGGQVSAPTVPTREAGDQVFPEGASVAVCRQRRGRPEACRGAPAPWLPGRYPQGQPPPTAQAARQGRPCGFWLPAGRCGDEQERQAGLWLAPGRGRGPPLQHRPSPRPWPGSPGS